MKPLLAATAFALLAACATPPQKMAQVECKVAPITTGSIAGRAKPVSSIEQRYAEMQLANSDYRLRQLQERGMVQNTVEDALRDCDRATR